MMRKTMVVFLTVSIGVFPQPFRVEAANRNFNPKRFLTSIHRVEFFLLFFFFYFKSFLFFLQFMSLVLRSFFHLFAQYHIGFQFQFVFSVVFEYLFILYLFRKKRIERHCENCLRFRDIEKTIQIWYFCISRNVSDYETY